MSSVDDEFEEKKREAREEGTHVHVIDAPTEEAKEELLKLQKKAPNFTALMVAANAPTCECKMCTMLRDGGHVSAWVRIQARVGLRTDGYMHDGFVLMIDKHGPAAVERILNDIDGWGDFAMLVGDSPVTHQQADRALRALADKTNARIKDPELRSKTSAMVSAVFDRPDRKKGINDVLDHFHSKVITGEMSAEKAAEEAVGALEKLLGIKNKHTAAAVNAQEGVPAADSPGHEESDDMSENSATMTVDRTEQPKAKPPMSGKWKEIGIVREGTQIVLPDGMTHNEAIEWIKRRRDEEERTVAVVEEIHGYPLDAAIAFVKALQEVKGFISLEATPTFFGPKPPAMITVETGVGETTQVPWGRMVVPGIEGFLATQFGKKDALPILVVTGEVQMRFREEVALIANTARRILREDSIYRGKAIRVRFPEDDPENFDPTLMPTFIDVAKVDETQLIFPEAVARQVKTSIFTPIEHTEKCRAAKIPLKRGVLLEGPYGTGKTLTAYVTAKKCQENKWTFLYLDTVAHLEQAILFARAYAPACIFAEDIDRVVEGERTVEMDAILNTIDGVDTKSAELMVILTTNHVEDINRAMLRPGRLDAVIPVRAPDAAAAERLVRQYGANMLRAGDDLTEVGKRLAGQIPAVIREVVERSKLAAVSHQSDAGGDLVVTAEDLFTAADGMVTHLELLAKDEVEETPGEAMARVFGQRFGEMLNSKTTVMPSMKAIEKEAASSNGSHKTA